MRRDHESTNVEAAAYLAAEEEPTVTPIMRGQRLMQRNGSQPVRLVEVLDIDGHRVRVRALHGPLRGTEYDLDAAQLQAPLGLLTRLPGPPRGSRQGGAA